MLLTGIDVNFIKHPSVRVEDITFRSKSRSKALSEVTCAFLQIIKSVKLRIFDWSQRLYFFASISFLVHYSYITSENTTLWCYYVHLNKYAYWCKIDRLNNIYSPKNLKQTAQHNSRLIKWCGIHNCQVIRSHFLHNYASHKY